MTLLDSRAGIVAVLRRINDEAGYRIDVDGVAQRLGPPIDQLVAPWVPEAEHPALVERFRELYPTYAITPATLLPGAREAIDAVRRACGRVLVVTGKHEPNARLHLEHLRVDHDVLVGNLWSDGKAGVLRAERAEVYVGDHPGDMIAATLAGARGVAVRTDTVDPQQLVDAGAGTVLDSLADFPRWLTAYAQEANGDR